MTIRSLGIALLLTGTWGTLGRAEEGWATFTATAYCSCTKCCGPKAQGITASGHRLRPGDQVIAVDPEVIPLRSVVELRGLGRFAALDTGSAIKGRRIDIWMNDHQAALQFGRRAVKLRVLRSAGRARAEWVGPEHELWGALRAAPPTPAGGPDGTPWTPGPAPRNAVWGIARREHPCTGLSEPAC
jgi:3D (Asp-Asp-Asp) domain-containing protein